MDCKVCIRLEALCAVAMASFTAPKTRQAWGSLRVGGDFPPSYNRAPGQMHPVVRQAPDLSLELVPMRWGFVPHWGAQSKVLPISTPGRNPPRCCPWSGRPFAPGVR